MKVLFVGQNPSKDNTDPNVPFKGTKSHTILVDWLKKLDLKESDCLFINASDKLGKVTLKDVVVRKLEMFLGYLNSNDKIICLGNFAYKATLRQIPSHIKENNDTLEVFKLPHPSPRNRLLNDKEWVGQKLKECKKFLEE